MMPMSVEEERKPFFFTPPLPTSSSSFSILPPQQHLQQSRRPSRYSWRATRRDVVLLFSGILLGFLLFKLIFTQQQSQQQQQQHQQQQKPARNTLDFLVVGDWGRRGLYNQSQIAIQMGRIGEQLGIQFVISAGDNFYQTGLQGTNDSNFAASFTNVYTAPSLQTKWYAVLGNHDYMGDALSQFSTELVKRDWRWSCQREFDLRQPLCDATEPCNEFAEFFFIDTTPFVTEYWDSNSKHTFDWRGLASREVQLKSQLQSLAHQLSISKATWKIVIGHHTVMSVGHHGDTPELVDQLLPILERYKVDAYINGHDHNLQHIKRSNSSVHFFTSGGGSKAFKGLRPYGREAGVHFVFDGQGFLAVSMTKGSILFRFHDVFGEVLYSYRLER
eukprot:c40110_g1_i1 orf=317-1480(-)